MRSLTLDEKITIKGALAKYGVLPTHLVRLTMLEAVHFWYRCIPGPISAYPKVV